MDINQSDTQLRHAKIDLMTKSVFLSTICLSLKHTFTDQISTAGTNGLSIIYNPEFLEGLTAQERTGLLAHEVWHVAFNHLTRIGSRDKVIWNKAGDYVINYMLTNAGFTIPKGGLLDPRFEKMSTEEVYEIIKDESDDEHGGSDFDIDLLDPPPGTDAQDVADKVTDMIIKAQLQSKIAGKEKGEIPDEIARAIDAALENKTPMIIISKSGGARMMEAAFSLMQMAKTSAKLALLAEAKLPYISVLTDPTTGGITASFAMLGDINIAEPKALIGFAGPRVIKETIGKDLPEGFQRSEFLQEKGFVDFIVHRKDLKQKIHEVLHIIGVHKRAAKTAS